MTAFVRRKKMIGEMWEKLKKNDFRDSFRADSKSFFSTNML